MSDARSVPWDIRPLLAVSFSGGRTSALMAINLHKQYGETHRIETTFANTGCEHELTLKFVDQCDRHFGWNVVWLEAVVSSNPKVGIRHKVVDYFTASRKGEPFEAYIKRYGIPNQSMPQCTTRLKTEVMESYLKTRGFYRGRRLNYQTAIGIRHDEMDRMVPRRKKNQFIYPLAEQEVTKADVIRFWRSMPFDLELPGEHYGNCVTCWKKSPRKLMTLANEAPESFDFFERMEQHSGRLAKRGPRLFFRGDMTVAMLKEQARTTKFQPYSDSELPAFDVALDVGAACGSSCEPVGADK